MKKRVVISAVNFVEGGPLTILRSSLRSAAEVLDENWEIYAFVHDKSLFDCERVIFVEFPAAKSSWIKRLVHEWLVFLSWSKKIKPDLWFSLHDITPRVKARRQSVYCHNPSPFYKITMRDALWDPKFAVFCLLYKFVYQIGVHKNHSIVVQQEWIRDEFVSAFGHSNVLVAYPSEGLPDVLHRSALYSLNALPTRDQPLILFYPALPRTFKNFEVLCLALQRLPLDISDLIRIRITIDGSENAYSRYIVNKYSSVRGLEFIGRQTKSQMHERYRECAAVLFPSKLETWGLPITEAKELGIPVLVADLPYAKETVGNYDYVSFLPPNDPGAWARAIASIASGTFSWQGNKRPYPAQPFASNWRELWLFLTSDL